MSENQKTKKKLWIFSVVLIIAFGAYILNKLNKTMNSGTTSENTSVENNTGAAASKTNVLADSDNDGLPDWEEELRGTNPQSPDTDSDGTLDKEEIRFGRNPLIPSPNDTVKDEYTSQIKSIDNLLPSKGQSTQTVDTPKTEEIKTPNLQPENNPAEIVTLKNFGNNLAAVIKKYAGNIADDGKTFAKAAISPDKETLDKLLKIALKYKNLAGELAKMEISEKASEIIKNFRINLINLSASTENLAKIGADGKIPVGNFQKYGENAMESNKSVIEIMKFFKNEGIQFSPNEDGYIFRLP